MNTKLIVGVLAALMLVSVAATPAVAAQADQAATEKVDECKNADNGPDGDAGPPGFVSNLVPDFLGDLFASLPAPDFVKSAFGAETC